MTDDEIMTLEEVAKYLKLQPQTVYKWAQEGQIPAAKLGKEWRFRKRVLDEWVDNSMILSKGGFNLMMESSERAVLKKAVPKEELEKILKEAME